MLMVLSPAKTLDFESKPATRVHSQPLWPSQSAQLVDVLRGLDAPRLGELMDISDALAQLNVERFQSWEPHLEPGAARQAVLAFAGDVYEGLQAASLGTPGLKWAQRHLRILSGLYGLLRPLDLIRPYRLEMGTRLSNPRGHDLYAFWGDQIARELARELSGMRRKLLVNLASDEYFRAVDLRALGHPVLQPVFQERRGGVYKVVSFSAKRARGLMARFAIESRITDPEALKAFDQEGYRFDAKASDAHRWFFRREAP